jgi:hypothetical protein
MLSQTLGLPTCSIVPQPYQEYASFLIDINHTLASGSCQRLYLNCASVYKGRLHEIRVNDRNNTR